MKKGKMDQVEANIWLCVILLSVFGCIMILSASASVARVSKDCNYDMLHYVKKQGQFLALGLALMVVARYVNYNLLKYFAVPAYLAGIVCIFLLKTGLGVEVNGAFRWLRFGPLQFQVAELVKVSTILVLALILTICTGRIWSHLIVLFLWVSGALMAGLLYKVSNDLSSAIVVIGITFFISFVCTRTVGLHLVAMASAGVKVYKAVMEVATNMPTPEEIENLPFRTARIAAWLAPERYAQGKGYQTLQALYSFGSGGFLGRGLGAGLQKGKIPEVHTDMIFSVIAEELGIPGVFMVILLIIFLAYKIMVVSVTAENIMGSVVALGVMAHIMIQSIINIAVNVNFFPNTGLPLPFVSYGGSSICFLLLEMAFVVAIERYHSIEAQKRNLRHEVHFGTVVLENVPTEELLEDMSVSNEKRADRRRSKETGSDRSRSKKAGPEKSRSKVEESQKKHSKEAVPKTANGGGIYTRYTKSSLSREEIQRRQDLETKAQKQQAARAAAERNKAQRYAAAADRRRKEAARERNARRPGQSS